VGTVIIGLSVGDVLPVRPYMALHNIGVTKAPRTR